jgi:hypothetical protein
MQIKTGVYSVALEGHTVRAPLVVPIVLLLNDTNHISSVFLLKKLKKTIPSTCTLKKQAYWSKYSILCSKNR